MKKLKRSSKNKVIAGIFGGLGEYMDVDPTILRLIGLLVFIVTGLFPFIIVYVLAALIVPKTEEQIKMDAETPAWKKWWFWIIILLIILFLLPILLILTFRGIGPIANVNIHTNDQTGFKDVNEAHQIIKEERVPDEGEIIDYLEEEFIDSENTFANYHEFGRDLDNVYLWAYIASFNLEEGEFTQEENISLPIAIKFEEGKVIDHIKPANGSEYEDSIRAVFPSQIADQVLNFEEKSILSSENEYQKVILQLENSVNKKAEEALEE